MLRATGEGNDVEKDLRFQLGSWRVQRVGWFGFATIVAGSLAGLAGDGPLAEHSIEASRFTLAYPSPMVVGRQARISISLKDSLEVSEGKPIELQIRSDLKHLRDVKLIPEPLRVEGRDHSVVAIFDKGVRRIFVELVLEEFGRAHFQIQFAEAQAEADIWIFP